MDGRRIERPTRRTVVVFFWIIYMISLFASGMRMPRVIRMSPLRDLLNGIYFGPLDDILFNYFEHFLVNPDGSFLDD